MYVSVILSKITCMFIACLSCIFVILLNKFNSIQYVTMQITFVTRKFRNVERNLHCDVLHITTVRVARLVLDCNGVFAIKA